MRCLLYYLLINLGVVVQYEHVNHLYVRYGRRQASRSGIWGIMSTKINKPTFLMHISMFLFKDRKKVLSISGDSFI